MERLVQAWPVPVNELIIIGHSMGGLLARSACHYAMQGDLTWLRHLKKLVCLGTPHHGAPLERAGNWLNLFGEISPYTAPFARLGKIRSAGIQDLRYGLFLEAQQKEPYCKEGDDLRKWMPLPEGVACFVIAATKQQQPHGPGKDLPGDGLVPVKSALGQHEHPTLTLPIPPSHQHICYGLNHLDLLSSSEVYDQIHRWLATGNPASR
jgi:pimeloyl-ACP methyl ester carboxylesterase